MDGWRLRAAREWYGVGLPEFAKYLGVSEARYRNWEQEGERFRAPNDLATIVRLAEVLGVTEGWLMGRPTAARWNEDVHGLRQFLRRELAARTDLAGLSDAPRVAAVMAAVGRYRNDRALHRPHQTGPAGVAPPSPAQLSSNSQAVASTRAAACSRRRLRGTRGLTFPAGGVSLNQNNEV